MPRPHAIPVDRYPLSSTYSARSASTGSTRDARQAGANEAPNATVTSTNATPAYVSGSVASISKSSPESNRDTADVLTGETSAIGGAAGLLTPERGSHTHDVEIFRAYWPRTGIVDSSQAEPFQTARLMSFSSV